LGRPRRGHLPVRARVFNGSSGGAEAPPDCAGGGPRRGHVPVRARVRETTIGRSWSSAATAFGVDLGAGMGRCERVSVRRRSGGAEAPPLLRWGLKFRRYCVGG